MKRRERLDESFDWRDYLTKQDIIRSKYYGSEYRIGECGHTQRKQTKNNV